MAYAAVLLARQKMEHIMHPSQSNILLPDSEMRSEMRSVYRELCCLESLILVRYADLPGSKLRVDDLEEQIEDVVHKFKDLIESQIPSAREVLKVNIEIRSFTEKLKNKEQCDIEEDQRPVNYSAAANAVSPRIHCPGGHRRAVGLDSELLVLQKFITGSPWLAILSVVGMVGIGKTTLVREFFDLQSTRDHFDLRFWVTVGPNCNLRQVLQLILRGHMDDTHNFTNDHLEEKLYDILAGSSYLIVLDDAWNTEVRNGLRRCFPETCQGSRIIITTRLHNVTVDRIIIATRLHDVTVDRDRIHEKLFLNDEDSWNLLHATVFTSSGESCSPQLEKIGREIAKNCEGLPMAILAVGRHLRLAEKTVEHWKEVLEDDNPLDFIKDDDANFSKSLYLSYKMLPQRLKACFLHIGVFPRNYEISVPKLVKLWVAEGFIGPQRRKSSEGMAEECLRDLVSRSVVLVRENSSTSGRIKTCRVHVVFRNLCLDEARNEKFCHVIKKYANSFPQGTNLQQRLCFHNNVVLGFELVNVAMKFASSTRSLLCFGPPHPHPLRLYLSFRLLRVLDALPIRFYEFPHQVLELARLSYLAITYDGELPKSISKLWNLEVLIVGRHHSIKSSDAAIYLPMEIWTLRWLRHLDCTGRDLPDPSTGADDHHFLENLLTLSGVSARSCTQGVLARMHNLKKLGIRLELKQDEFETFSFFGDVAQKLHHLESFKCVVVGNLSLNYQVDPPMLCFPIHIRRLTLSGCGFPWENMTAIGCLRDLQVLKLRCYAFRGPVWECCREWEFIQLEFLLLEDLDIKHWRANYLQFPRLQRLIIRHCYKLQEIPMDLREIRTIEVDDCGSSLVSWAQQLRRPQVQILSSCDEI